MIEFIVDFWGYLRVRKKYWLTPIILFLILLSFLIFFAETSPVAPFLYPFF